MKLKIYFELIIEIIKIWENDYIEIYKIFKDKFKEKGISIKVFKDKINNYNEEVFEIFKEIYFKIIFGIEFNLLINLDIVWLFEEINFKLFELGNYIGIFVVFDEFSKFFEVSVLRNLVRDIKLI